MNLNFKNKEKENRGKETTEATNLVNDTETDVKAVCRGNFEINDLKCVDQPGMRLRRRSRDSGQIFENLTWLTSNEAAEYLRLPSVGALRVLVFQRRVPFHKLGRNLRFKKGELDHLLETSRTGGI
jgi:excisionase family DNA binding protein